MNTPEQNLALVRAANERSERALRAHRDALIAERNELGKLFQEAKEVNKNLGDQIERIADCIGAEGTAVEIADAVIATWNTRATAPAAASHEEWRKENYAKWLRAREKPHVPEGTKSTGITLPAPASGWMEEIARAHYYGIEGTKVAQAGLVRLIARHAPDVAKLEATVATLRYHLARETMIEDDYGVPGSSFYTCPFCHEESGAGVLNKGIEHKADCILFGVAIPPPENLAKMLQKEREKRVEDVAALEAENARLREALQRILTRGFSVQAEEQARQALAASPAPSAWRETLAALTDEQRLEIFSQFCTHCGSTDPKCQCSNDE